MNCLMQSENTSALKDDLFSVSLMEQDFFQKKYDKVFSNLLQLFEKLKFDYSIFNSFDTECEQDSQIENICTRIANVFGWTVISSEFEVTDTLFFKISLFKDVYTTIFSISGFRTTNHFIEILTKQLAQNLASSTNFNNQSQVIKKILILYSLENSIDLDLTIAQQEFPWHATYAYASMLSQSIVISETAYRKKEELLKHADILNSVTPDNVGLLYLLCKLYMLCSCATGNHKREVKKNINLCIVRYLEINNIKINQVTEQTFKRKKPYLIIILEYFNSEHSIYRCYKQFIELLKNNFFLIAVVEETCIDQQSVLIFDQIIKIEPEAEFLSNIIQKIANLNPNAIYYPSIGMKQWAITMSNIRLAPVQFMTGGHPASSFSKEIDFFLFEECYFYEQTQLRFSEKIVCLPNNAMPITRLSALESIANERIEVDALEVHDKINIAVPALFYKLNYGFLQTLKIIKMKSNINVIFHFFPNTVGLRHSAIKTQILNLFSDAIVHERMAYEQYCENLSKCKIYVSTFPLCDTNSSFDCLQFGLIPVTLNGLEEFHARFDTELIKSLSLPEWLITQSIDEYIKAVLKLIEMIHERQNLSDLCKKNIVAFRKEPNSAQISQGIYNLVVNHETFKLKSSPIMFSELF